MGQKGDKHTIDAQQAADLLLEKLSPIEGISSKKMFGGHGIFHSGKMFGIIDSKGQAFLKTSASTKEKYEARGSSAHGKMPYHAIPKEVLDSEELIDWVKESIQVSAE